MGSEMPQQFDDVLTELLIDKINLWFRTFKLNPSYAETTISREVLVEHVQRHVIQPNKIANAAKELLKIPSVVEAAGVTDENEKEFISHANRYFEMYLPNAGCEIAETPRYSGSDKREACIIATKKWQVGDEIKYCTGVLVPITSEEERALEGGRDFSIMWSTRKDCMCLLLGPARFVNHDCDPNTHFIATGQNTISFKLLRDVAIGEELTAHYGENYFGQGNEECLCVTCEQKQTGGFKKVRDEKEEETYEGLRPFVYNDGRLVRRSMRRNKAIQFNNTTKNKSKSVPVRINKNMDDDSVAENSSIDINSDTSPADDHTTSTQIQLDLDERTSSVKTQPTIDTNFSERITSTNKTENKSCFPVNSASIPVRQKTFSEPLSFKALFSTSRPRLSVSFTTINSSSGNPNRSNRLSRDISTGDQESRTDDPQESCNKSSKTSVSNTVTKDDKDDSRSRSTSQRPNRDSGVLMHTTITNSRANQEITSTELSIQSNVSSEQSPKPASTVVPHVNRGINSISISKFPQSTTDDSPISTNRINSRNTSKHNSFINRRVSEPVYATRTIERVPNISPMPVNQDSRRSTVPKQTSNTGLSRQRSNSLNQKELLAIGEMSPWAGVELTANPNFQITCGIETTRQFKLLENNNSRQKQASLSTAYKGKGNKSRATNTNTSRMSIAYLLSSNDLPRQKDSKQKPSNTVFFNDKLNIKRVCRVCREKFAPLPTSANGHKCPRCLRHFSLYNLEWPLRKQPRQPKEKGKVKETKNRNEIISRRDKKATAMAPIINNSKGKTRQMSASVTYIGDKKEHNERMQAVIFAESNEEWLPVPGIDKEKYAVGAERPTAGKAFSISMKRKKNEKGEGWYKPFLRWSASTGYVHLNSIWRYVEFHTSPDSNKLRMVKRKIGKTGFEENGNFSAASLQGGYATYQGDWVPYEDALKIVEELDISELLRKFILPPGGNVAATSSSLGAATSSKRKYDEIDAGDSDNEPSHKKRT